MSSSSLRVVNIGNIASIQGGAFATLKNYAGLYNTLIDSGVFLSLFAGHLKKGEIGYDFLNDEELDSRIGVTTYHGNNAITPFFRFISVNFIAASKLLLFCRAKDDYFVFLPSPVGALALLWIMIFNRAKSLGVYIGGDFRQEQQAEFRKSRLKRLIKKLGGVIIEQLIDLGIRRADYVLTSSYECYHRFEKLDKVRITPPMLNVSEEELSDSPGTRQSTFITYCGELRRAKGCFDLLIAFEFMCQNRPSHLMLKIIGDGELLDEMTQYVQQRGLQDKVVFTGLIRDRRELAESLRNSLLFVLPSYSEGFPRVAYECFTLGVPTILTPVGGIPYLVEDKVHCLLVSPGDIRQIAAKMEMLSSDANLRVKIAANASSLMKEQIFPRIRKDGSLAQLILKNVL